MPDLQVSGAGAAQVARGAGHAHARIDVHGSSPDTLALVKGDTGAAVQIHGSVGATRQQCRAGGNDKVGGNNSQHDTS